MTPVVRLLHSRFLNTRYLTLIVSRQQNHLRILASVGVLMTLVGLLVAQTVLPWYLVAVAIVLAAASVIVSQPLVSVAYAACYLVLWIVCTPRAVSIAALVAALGFVLWHGALSVAGSVPMAGRLAARTLRRWARRLGITAVVVIAVFVVALILEDPGRAPSRVAVAVACLLVLIVLVGALAAGRRRTRPVGGTTDASAEDSA